MVLQTLTRIDSETYEAPRPFSLGGRVFGLFVDGQLLRPEGDDGWEALSTRRVLMRTPLPPSSLVQLACTLLEEVG